MMGRGLYVLILAAWAVSAGAETKDQTTEGQQRGYYFPRQPYPMYWQGAPAYTQPAAPQAAPSARQVPTVSAPPPPSPSGPAVPGREVGATGSSSTAIGGPFRVVETRIGRVVADADGMTLYQPRDDVELESTAHWRMLPVGDDVAEAVAPFAPLSGSDGKRYWGYRGRTLYRWFGDITPGDVTGQGVDGIWSAVRP